jgi:hypothetical protein
MSGIATLLPFPDRLGRHPTQIAYRRSGVGDTAEFVDTIPDETRDRPFSRVYDGSSLVAGSYASAGCCRQQQGEQNRRFDNENPHGGSSFICPSSVANGLIDGCETNILPRYRTAGGGKSGDFVLSLSS